MEQEAEHQEQAIVNITGKKVALGPLRSDLLPLYVKWINDFEVTRTLGVTRMRPMTWQAEEAWLEDASMSDREVGFTIYERSSMRPIGSTSLRDVDHYNRTATFGILIGEKDCWGKGYGSEVTSLMLDYGFFALGLHNIMLTVFSNNQRAVRVYQRAGFREIGRRRQAHRLGGEVHDVIYMDCLETEFQSRLMRRLLNPEQTS